MTRARDWDPASPLRRHLEALVGERSPLGSPASLLRAERHAEEALVAAGYKVSREPILVAKGAWHNIVGDREGDAGNPLFIVGAHLDTVEGTPGADDNASGVAALLALAEWAGLRSPSSRVALRFVAFNLEEWGMAGSLEHADAIHTSRRSVEGMISLEMLGYIDESRGSQKYPPGMGLGRRRSGDFISVVGDLSSRRLTKQVASSLRDGGLPVEAASMPAAAALLVGASLSDHSSFWRRGMKAVMVGDTAFYRNPHYHQPTDTLETLSIPFLEKVTRGLAIFLESLGL